MCPYLNTTEKYFVIFHSFICYFEDSIIKQQKTNNKQTNKNKKQNKTKQNKTNALMYSNVYSDEMNNVKNSVNIRHGGCFMYDSLKTFAVI